MRNNIPRGEDLVDIKLEHTVVSSLVGGQISWRERDKDRQKDRLHTTRRRRQWEFLHLLPCCVLFPSSKVSSFPPPLKLQQQHLLSPGEWKIMKKCSEMQSRTRSVVLHLQMNDDFLATRM